MTLINAIAALMRGIWSGIFTATESVQHNPLLLLAIIIPAVIVGALLLVIRRQERAGRR